jgi:hypothetical protein
MNNTQFRAESEIARHQQFCWRAKITAFGRVLPPASERQAGC